MNLNYHVFICHMYFNLSTKSLKLSWKWYVKGNCSKKWVRKIKFSLGYGLYTCVVVRTHLFVLVLHSTIILITYITHMCVCVCAPLTQVCTLNVRSITHIFRYFSFLCHFYFNLFSGFQLFVSLYNLTISFALLFHLPLLTSFLFFSLLYILFSFFTNIFLQISQI